MSKWRKRPVVIDAEQFDGETLIRGVMREPGADAKPFVVTVHGQRCYVVAGDWIIPELDGEHFYPCKPDIFAATYESVDDGVPREATPPPPSDLSAAWRSCATAAEAAWEPRSEKWPNGASDLIAAGDALDICAGSLADVVAQFLDLCPRVSDADPIAPALRDLCHGAAKLAMRRFNARA